jgi:hypothetical protein
MLAAISGISARLKSLMHFKAVLVTLALAFLVPAFVSTADAAQDGSACKTKRAKKQDGDSKSKKKDKDGKKSYGFEL